MSIRQIRVKQFKALSDPGPIELRPLTLLVGPNSSGKSSVIQALLMMKQTAESTDVEIPLVTEAPGAHAHMGHYRDFVHGHRLSSQIELEIVFEGRMRGRVLRGSPQSPTSETCRLGARFSYRAQRRQRIVPTESWIEIPERRARACRAHVEGERFLVSASVDGETMYSDQDFGFNKFYPLSPGSR